MSNFMLYLNKSEVIKVEIYAPIIVALSFNGLDLLTGIISAIRLQELKSSRLRDGLFKKVGFILCYFLAWIMDNYGSIVGFKLPVDILPVIILYVCTTELVSILENITKINPDILPDKLMQMFHVKHQD
jgi:toxin secretion/phage lysis holin